MVVGEAPGETEVAQRKPFVGSAGLILNQLLAATGIHREDIYITNVVKVRPPKNDLSRLHELGVLAEDYYPMLAEEIAAVQPTVIVAAGAVPLKALTTKDGIMKWRGSVLPCTLHPGPLVVPMLHPAYLLRDYSMHPSNTSDLLKARRIIEHGYTEPTYDIRVAHSVAGVREYLDHCRDSGAFSFDIETLLRSRIRCLGFAAGSHSACVVPFKRGHANYWSEADEVAVWGSVRRLFAAQGVVKIAQNAQFDLTWTVPHTGFPAPQIVDTMLAHHLVCPELPHDLDFLASMYTDLNYYGVAETDRTGDYDLHTYNAKDCMATFQVWQVMEQELRRLGLLEFYQGYTMPLLRALFEMQHRGVLIDPDILATKIKDTKLIIDAKQAELEALVGHPINVKSTKQKKELFYDQLGATPIYNRKAKTPTITTNKEALNKLIAKGYGEAQLVAEVVQLRDSVSHLKRVKIDEDGLIHTEFVVSGTVTGRLSSREAVNGSGTNLQNIPKHVRAAFIPRPGRCFVKGDLSQAENRVVAWLIKGPMQRAFVEHRDVHSLTASLIFGGAEADHPKESKGRQLAKVINHASNYGQGPQQLAATLKIGKAEGRSLLDRYHRAYPQVKEWHASIRDELRATRTLTHCLGRRRVFLARWGDELFRAAYAFIPQGTVGDLINQSLVELWLRLKPLGAYPLLQVHDEIIVECSVADAPLVRQLMHTVIEQPLVAGGEPLTIPLESKICHMNWLG